MKTSKIVAALAVSSFSALTIASAFARGDSVAIGHYEWQPAPQHGPRAPLQGAMRRWVPDAPQVANCDCGMMKMGSAETADRIKTMHGAMPASGSSAS